jgi:quinol monooxygenase YgiN
MTKFALYIPLRVKPGKEEAVADFLRLTLPLVDAEPGTMSWYAGQEGSSVLSVFAP